MHPFSGTWPWLECLRVTIRVVGANIRNQDLVGLWIFHISTTHFKERKRTKKKETAAATTIILLLH